MIEQEQVLKLLSEQILDPGTQWSLGTFGGIAEFSRDPNEAVKLTTSGGRIAAKRMRNCDRSLRKASRDRAGAIVWRCACLRTPAP